MKENYTDEGKGTWGRKVIQQKEKDPAEGKDPGKEKRSRKGKRSLRRKKEEKLREIGW